MGPARVPWRRTFAVDRLKPATKLTPEARRDRHRNAPSWIVLNEGKSVSGALRTLRQRGHMTTRAPRRGSASLLVFHARSIKWETEPTKVPTPKVFEINTTSTPNREIAKNASPAHRVTVVSRTRNAPLKCLSSVN